MQRAQSGAQAVQRGAVRALMRHWPVAAAAAVAWPIDAGSANAGSVRALGWARAERLRACGAVPERVVSAHRPIGGVGVHVHLDAGSWPSWSLSMLGARRIWSARHERPKTARRSALTIPTAPIAWIRQRHALAASTVRGARPLPTGPVRQDGTTPACWEAGVIPSGTIKQSRLSLIEPRGTR